MTEQTPKPGEDQGDLAGVVSRKAARKLRARRDGAPQLWFGLGVMGLIGWTIAVPALLGAALGAWLDHRAPGGHSWTLALLMAGLTIGCFTAWHWVAQQDRDMHADAEDEDE
jgi:ATP synthase protein I